jgi:hypothetical protein
MNLDQQLPFGGACVSNLIGAPPQCGYAAQLRGARQPRLIGLGCGRPPRGWCARPTVDSETFERLEAERSNNPYMEMLHSKHPKLFEEERHAFFFILRDTVQTQTVTYT